ncbi:MAG: putative nucleotidyltransferase substrate binding domain-containing protein [Chthoniobacterales bacterium]
MSWISKFIVSLDRPSEAEAALVKIASVWPKDFPVLSDVVAGFPLGAAAFGKLICHSSASVEKIYREPGALLWLADASVCDRPRGRKKMNLDWHSIKAESSDNISALRKFKTWELLRVALREVAGISDILETGAELSAVAEICVEEVYAAVLQECTVRWGDSGDDLVVLGMGKLGGEELNYSSDIDLVAFYGEDGDVKPGFGRQDFFNRVFERFLATFSAQDNNGNLFKVDLRLRPEGNSGALTRSMAGMENYYAGFGETWERMALIKARRITGSKELAYDFETVMQAFIYPKSLSHEVVDEVAGIKARIERDILAPDELYRNVKLGRGGIREIEFTVQTLQLLHGARHPFLQEKNTLRALANLAKMDFLPLKDAQALHEAYIFLRKVEHRLQISREEQTHTIPANVEELHFLALNLNFADSSIFLERLNDTMKYVRFVFERILEDKNSSPVLKKGGVVEEAIFQDIISAKKMLEKLGAPDPSKHVSPRTRQLYDRLKPMLLNELGKTAEPDSALAGFVDFVEAYGIRGMLFETLASNPRLLELLIKLFDASYFLTRAVVRRPQWIEEIARSGELGLSYGVEAHRKAILEFETQSVHAPIERIRIYRQFQTLRIGLRDILGFSNLLELQMEYTAMAEACMLEVMDQLHLKDKITVIAMGKFGGEELCYGSDLDIVVIGEDQNGTAAFSREMNLRGENGLLFPMDARLRPEGSASPLATPFEMYKKYYEGRAQIWEIQALTRARIISGPLRHKVEKVIADALQTVKGQKTIIPEIAAMHDRVVKNRNSGEDENSFKTGQGGLMAMEFIVQALLMLHGIQEPNTMRAIDNLSTRGILSEEKADDLKADYLFLRQVELCLRRIEDTSVSDLPSDAKRRNELTRRMGFSEPEHFFARYGQARSKTKALFAALIN